MKRAIGWSSRVEDGHITKSLVRELHAKLKLADCNPIGEDMVEVVFEGPDGTAAFRVHSRDETELQVGEEYTFIVRLDSRDQ